MRLYCSNQHLGSPAPKGQKIDAALADALSASAQRILNAVG
jgi:hypothetical protein